MPGNKYRADGVYQRMISSWRSIVCLAISAAYLHLAPSKAASPAGGTSGNPPSMLGRLIDEPERLSGLWETPDGPGDAVGIWLLLTTQISGAPSTLANIPQYQQHLSVSLFHRSGNELAFGTGSSFQDEPGGGMTWDGRHLRADRGWRNNDASTVKLDLTCNPGQQIWSGFFRRGTFAKSVTLRRSACKPVTSSSALVGTWTDTAKGSHACFHIVEAADGTLLGWSDGLQTPRVLRYANGLQPPTSTTQHYGYLLRVTRPSEDTFSIEFGACSGICCSSTFTGSLANRAALVGTMVGGQSHSARPSAFKKLNGDICRVHE